MEKIYPKKYTDKYAEKAIESFNSRLELYLFELAKNDKMKEFSWEFFLTMHEKAEFSKELLENKCKEYGSSYSGKPADFKEIDDRIGTWCEDNEKNFDLYFEKYFNIYNKIIFPKEIYNQLLKEEECYYCKTKFDYIEKLIEDRKIFRKSYTRGKSRELDRKIPNWEYSADNTVACCYWCNNAKTDEFFGDEFIDIGMKMGEVFKNRISNP